MIVKLIGFVAELVAAPVGAVRALWAIADACRLQIHVAQQSLEHARRAQPGVCPICSKFGGKELVWLAMDGTCTVCEQRAAEMARLAQQPKDGPDA